MAPARLTFLDVTAGTMDKSRVICRAELLCLYATSPAGTTDPEKAPVDFY